MQALLYQFICDHYNDLKSFYELYRCVLVQHQDGFFFLLSAGNTLQSRKLPKTGKSTLAMCLCYALLPDRKVLDIHPISEVQDSHSVGIDFMTGIVNPAYDYAYIVLDITTRFNTRLLAGVHVSIKDGQVDF